MLRSGKTNGEKYVIPVENKDVKRTPSGNRALRRFVEIMEKTGNKKELRRRIL